MSSIAEAEKLIFSLSEKDRAALVGKMIRSLPSPGWERSRWGAPTARELGFDILADSPFGIAGPKGMDPKVTKVLHDAFKSALDDPEHLKALSQLDLLYWYKSSEDYADWAIDQFEFQREFIRRTIGLFND